MFYYGLIFGGRKCLHATSQKRALSHAISLAVNYRLFSHGDVSYWFNGKNDNVVLEYDLRCVGPPKNRIMPITYKNDRSRKNIHKKGRR